MAYVALYRKWRPGSFRDLVGQEHISRTLAHAIETGHIGHAYLFSGPRGTGKTSTAKILAKALNCEQGPTPEPCNVCESCRRVNDGSSMDVFEIDAASNRGIDEIRDLRETVKFAPAAGRWKVYIIDEVHMLTAEAFNALLKTLEEPPAQVVFILATTEVHKVPATIQSRCQRYDFKRITAADIEGRLQYVAQESGIKAEPEALALIAHQADGGMRDALSILDQCAALSDAAISADRVREILGLVGREWVIRLTRAIAARDAAAALTAIAELLQDGKDLRQLLGSLIRELRSVMVYQAAGKLDGVESFETSEEFLQEMAAAFAPESFLPMIRCLHEALNELKWSSEPRITVETALLTLCRPAADAVAAPAAAGAAAPADEARVAQLEARLAQLAASVAALPKTAMMAPAAAPAPMPVHRPAVAAPAEEPVAVAVTPAGTALWQKLLGSLKAQPDKGPVYACVSKGTFRGMNERQFVIEFSSPFLKLRTDRDDYRMILEGELMRLGGQPWQLVCVQESAAPPPPPLPKAKPKPKPAAAAVQPVKVDMSQLPPKAQQNLEKAVSILDGDFVAPPGSPAPDHN